MRSPALPSSFSTTILSPGATRYCLPPVRTTANIGFSLLLRNSVPREQGSANTGRARKRAAYGRGQRLSTGERPRPNLLTMLSAGNSLRQFHDAAQQVLAL